MQVPARIQVSLCTRCRSPPLGTGCQPLRRGLGRSGDWGRRVRWRPLTSPACPEPKLAILWVLLGVSRAYAPSPHLRAPGQFSSGNRWLSPPALALHAQTCHPAGWPHERPKIKTPHIYPAPPHTPAGLPAAALQSLGLGPCLPEVHIGLDSSPGCVSGFAFRTTFLRCSARPRPPPTERKGPAGFSTSPALRRRRGHGGRFRHLLEDEDFVLPLGFPSRLYWERKAGLGRRAGGVRGTEGTRSPFRAQRPCRARSYSC